MGGFRPPPGGWAERGREGSGVKDYERSGGKDFMRDRGDREKDLEKWGKVREYYRFIMEEGTSFLLGGGGTLSFIPEAILSRGSYTIVDDSK